MHYLDKVPHGKSSVVFLSHVKPSKLVIFIHGFNGSALGTWHDFPKLVYDEPKFQEADIIFYGYDSLKMQAANMKLRFYDLLNDAVKPQSMSYLCRKLPGNFEYDKIIIVCHSLGAVVARLALLHAYDKKDHWISKCHIVLYAPAHWGSRIPGNFKECFEGILTFLRGVTKTKYPVIGDLTEGSIVLRDMQSRTQQLCTQGESTFVQADAVIWAEREFIVVNNRFCSDKPESDIIGTTHTSVCKPGKDFKAPFQKLLPHI
jgi:hypothetical protein